MIEERLDVKNRFVNDVKDFQMEVVQDKDANRFIRFKKPDTNICHFDIITWPGHLCISGDMGTFVFRRLHDMFEFFRGDDINPQYWSEKLTAHDSVSGHKKFSQERFEEQIKEWFEYIEFDDEDQKAEIWQQIKFEVLNEDNNHEILAIRAAMDFYDKTYGYIFQDFWESNLMEYDYCYLWCLYAIVWAIKKYDEIN